MTSSGQPDFGVFKGDKRAYNYQEEDISTQNLQIAAHIVALVDVEPRADEVRQCMPQTLAHIFPSGSDDDQVLSQIQYRGSTETQLIWYLGMHAHARSRGRVSNCRCQDPFSLFPSTFHQLCLVSIAPWTVGPMHC